MPVVTGRIASEVTDHWKVTTSPAVGLSGNSHMEDYEWLDLSPSPDFADWDHLSVHPDTYLDRYLNVDFAIGRDFALNDSLSINIHGGVKYTNTKWTAHGGSFIYSEGSFRDTMGSFPDGERVATFEQRYPGLFLGAAATALQGDWTFAGLIRGGATINASDTDHHWIHGIRFERDYSAIPFLSLGARADYAFNDRITVFLERTLTSISKKGRHKRLRSGYRRIDRRTFRQWGRIRLHFNDGQCRSQSLFLMRKVPQYFD
ncbi:omptin family outer membrane protease [Mesorhizobium sp. NPDC059025]|uniref:omptin family outer membrane protease n=1 Tax=unclassified Mesorhizobium TaxID=325217 RepID=UPI0036C0EC5C